MELKTYGMVLWRRWWIVLGVFAIATAVGVVGFAVVPPATTYQATVRIVAQPPPEPRNGEEYTFDGYYHALASEFLNDDLIELIRTQTFLSLVQERAIADSGFRPTGSLDGKKAHRLVTITASSSSARDAVALAKAAGEILTDSNQPEVIKAIGPTGATAYLVDPPALTAASSRRAMADVAIRALLGLIAGVALAFLIDYLDDSLRSPTEVEQLLGTPVLGAVPSFKRHGRRRLSGRGKRPAPSQAVITSG